MALPLLLDVAATHLRGRRRQSLVSVAGVALGVGFFIATAALMQGFQRYFVESIVDSTPHVVISDEFRTAPAQPAALAFDGAVTVRGVIPMEERRGVRNARRILDAVETLPGMTASPSLSGQVILRYGGRDTGVNLVGIEPSRELAVTRLDEDMVEGGFSALEAGTDGIVLGTPLAREIGVGLGDGVTVASPAGVVRRLEVVGLFHTGIQAVDDGQAYAALKSTQILLDRPAVVNRVRIRLEDVEAARALASRLEARFGYKAVSWQEANQDIFNAFNVQNMIMYSIVGAIMIVASFGIFNVISTVIHEKARDIAILISLGFRRSDIRRIFLVEGLAVGAIGALAGCAAGYGLTGLLASLRFDFGGPDEDRFHLAYSLAHYALGAGFALVSSGFAAWLPARKAARLNPVEIVRGAA